jgi:hypothetical protein
MAGLCEKQGHVHRDVFVQAEARHAAQPA